MSLNLPDFMYLSEEVRKAKTKGFPIVALETAVVTHGLPFPENISLAGDMENEIRAIGAVPATIGVINGEVHIGLSTTQLEILARAENCQKIGPRDFAPTIARLGSGGTTVGATLISAHKVGIKVLATGGIGGVHRQASYDVSADLLELARRPLVVVCAGAKAILDLRRTIEYLETMSIPVIGYQTDDFPAFYSRKSGFRTTGRADSPQAVVNIAHMHWKMGMSSAILVVVPPPKTVALPWDLVEKAIKQALREARERNITGQGVTPFLLKRVGELTNRGTLRANLGLLLNNARVAGKISRAFY